MESLRYIGNHQAASAVKRGVRRFLAIALLISLASGCGNEVTEDSDRPRSNTGLVLEVEALSYAAVALYADGVLFTPAPQIAIYPAPALPGYNVGQISPDRVAEILEAVRGSGLLDEGDSPPAPDATLLTVVTDGELRTVRLNPAQAAVLNELLADLPVSSGDALYEPTALAVFAGAPEDAVEGIEPETRDWPLGDLPPGCSVIRGADLPPVLAAAAQANQLTRWRSGAETYGLVFRPLLPHETSCDDVFAPTA